MKLSHLFCFLALLILLVLGLEAKTDRRSELKCGRNYSQTVSLSRRLRLGVVIDGGGGGHGTAIGKQQKVAIKLAALQRRQIRRLSSCNFPAKLELHFSDDDSRGNLTRRRGRPTPSAAILRLINGKKVEAVICSVSIEELRLMAEEDVKKFPDEVPIISLSSLSALEPQSHQPLKLPSFIQMANDITHHRLQCISAIVGHFQWPKLTIIHENRNDFNLIYGRISNQLSDLLQSVNAEIENHQAFSLSNPKVLIRKKLKKFATQRSRVFIVTQFSLEMAKILFSEAKKLNMMRNGYVWIVSDEIFDLFFNSLDPSILKDMEGVIGFQTYSDRTKMGFRSFESQFQKLYDSEYPEDHHESLMTTNKPSIFAVRAYDASQTIIKAMDKLNGNFSSSSRELLETILASDFTGIAGTRVSFKNGVLSSNSQSPTFQIIQIINKNYKDLSFWSPKLGFSENFNIDEVHESIINTSRKQGNDWNVNVHSSRLLINTDIGESERRLRIAVPANGACHEFVKVSYDHLKGTHVSGFSIDVFVAVVNNSPRPFLYNLVPFNGTYDDMIKAVYNKEFDGAAGDILIISNRFRYVDFTAQYLKAEIVMLVTEEQKKWKSIWIFMDAFDVTMWILMPIMHIFISSVIWVIERQNNKELQGLGNMLWFSVTTIFYMHREPIKNGMARLVLGPWLFAILVVTSSFTASLTSMLTIPLLRPSVLDVETLKQMGAPVGCNTNSFVCNYLINTLKFDREKIVKMNSLSDYRGSLQNGTIKAGFVISPQAKVFLAQNCKDFTQVASFKLNGLGFAFPKGSGDAVSVSASIVELIEKNEMPLLEAKLVASFNCSSGADGLGLGPGPFLGLFFICGSIASLVLLYMGLSLMILKLGQIYKPAAVHCVPLEYSKKPNEAHCNEAP